METKTSNRKEMKKPFWKSGLQAAGEAMKANGFAVQKESLRKAQIASASAAQQRREEYAANPKKCLCCETALSYQEVIKLKKKFCSRKCAATVNNQGRKRDLVSRMTTSLSVRNALGVVDKLSEEVLQDAWSRVAPATKCEQCGDLFKKNTPFQRFCTKKCGDSARRLPEKVRAENRVASVVNWRRRLKVKAVEYKGGCCQLCSYDRCLRALEFHHSDPSQKDFSIGANGIPRKWDVLRRELDKCILVCANCHRELHDEQSEE